MRWPTGCSRCWPADAGPRRPRHAVHPARRARRPAPFEHRRRRARSWVPGPAPASAPRWPRPAAPTWRSSTTPAATGWRAAGHWRACSPTAMPTRSWSRWRPRSCPSSRAWPSSPASTAPTRSGSCSVFLRQLRELGFDGVQNFPTVGLIDGDFRRNLEATGMSYDHGDRGHRRGPCPGHVHLALRVRPRPGDGDGRGGRRPAGCAHRPHDGGLHRRWRRVHAGRGDRPRDGDGRGRQGRPARRHRPVPRRPVRRAGHRRARRCGGCPGSTGSSAHRRWSASPPSARSAARWRRSSSWRSLGSPALVPGAGPA